MRGAKTGVPSAATSTHSLSAVIRFSFSIQSFLSAHILFERAIWTCEDETWDEISKSVLDLLCRKIFLTTNTPDSLKQATISLTVISFVNFFKLDLHLSHTLSYSRPKTEDPSPSPFRARYTRAIHHLLSKSSIARPLIHLLPEFTIQKVLIVHHLSRWSYKLWIFTSEFQVNSPRLEISLLCCSPLSD